MVSSRCRRKSPPDTSCWAMTGLSWSSESDSRFHVMSEPSPRRAKRSLGQNFLVDPNLQRKIVAALGATPNDEVVEVGPGRGALTHHLIGTVGRLVLIELDNELAAHWTAEAADRDDVHVVHGDVLEQPVWDHLGGSWGHLGPFGGSNFAKTSSFTV
ncbi:MAG TPA: hypothetical protein EYO97_01065 [Gemmatimonadetes bacterium]|nr:hypothetical protein [Gemmatimonadota bacterium]